jgi:hypothetical protein
MLYEIENYAFHVAELKRYQFWCNRCALRQLISLHWCLRQQVGITLWRSGRTICQCSIILFLSKLICIISQMTKLLHVTTIYGNTIWKKQNITKTSYPELQIYWSSNWWKLKLWWNNKHVLVLLKCDYLRFYFPLKNFSLIWRRHHCRWRAAKVRPMLSAQGLWAGRDLYRAIPTVTRDLGFSGLIRRTAPFSRLLRHTKGCGGSIRNKIYMYITNTSYQELQIYWSSNWWKLKLWWKNKHVLALMKSEK